MTFLFRLIFVVSLFVLFEPTVNAVGLSIQPARLKLSAEWGSAATKELLVSNITDQPAMYQVRSTGASDVNVQPSSFRLDPNGSQLVAVSFQPRFVIDRTSVLDVVATPLGGSPLALASGVHYPLDLVSTSRWGNAAVRGSLVAALLGAAFLIIRRHAIVAV